MPGDELEGGLIGLALRAVRTGTSANTFVAQLREAGAGVRRQVGLRVYAAAKALNAEYGQEPTRPLDRPPSPDEQRSWPVRSPSGVLQTVSLFYRERVTGNIVQRFYTVKTQQGISRGEAIQRAIDANVVNAIQYEQELIGGFHTGAAEQVGLDVA